MQADSLVGVPYVNDGRAFDGADCWGIVYLYYKHILAIEIERYDAALTDTGSNAGLAELMRGEIPTYWQAVDVPSVGDVALMRNGRHLSHVGIYVGADRVLHSPGPDASRIERASSASLSRRIVGYYRRIRP